jgi:hypothetical protein
MERYLQKNKQNWKGYTMIAYLLFLSATKAKIKSEYAVAFRLLASLMRRKPLANKCIHTSSHQLQKEHFGLN